MHLRSQRWTPFTIALALTLPLAGCFSAEGAATSNFQLQPQKVGWYAGEEAHFLLTIEASFFRSDPAYDVDRHFAIEEIKLEEKGLTFGGDFKTRNPDDVALRLQRDGAAADGFTLDVEHPTLEVFLTLPADLRDSSYTLSLKLFEVGWVESGVFRVDRR